MPDIAGPSAGGNPVSMIPERHSNALTDPAVNPIMARCDKLALR